MEDDSSCPSDENDEDYRPSDEFSGKSRDKKTTENGASINHVMKRRSSSKHDAKETSTGGHSDSVSKRGSSQHGSKDKRFDGKELKDMETSGGSSQKKGFIAEKSSDEVTASEAVEAENANPCDDGVAEIEGMKEDISKNGDNLLNSTPTEPSHTEEHCKGKRANHSDLNIFDTQVSGRNVTAGKDEANESSHAKRVTRNKPNAGVQTEEFVTKRRYSVLSRQQKYHSSTSSGDQGRDNSTFKNFHEKESEENHAEGAIRNKPDAGAAIEEFLKFHSSTSSDEGRNDSPFKNLSEKQSEEKHTAKKRKVHGSLGGRIARKRIGISLKFLLMPC